MAKFPVDAPLDRVVKALEHLGFHLARTGNHTVDYTKSPSNQRLNAADNFAAKRHIA